MFHLKTRLSRLLSLTPFYLHMMLHVLESANTLSQSLQRDQDILNVMCECNKKRAAKSKREWMELTREEDILILRWKHA
jgi:hypothetical protein